MMSKLHQSRLPVVFYVDGGGDEEYLETVGEIFKLDISVFLDCKLCVRNCLSRYIEVLDRSLVSAIIYIKSPYHRQNLCKICSKVTKNRLCLP